MSAVRIRQVTELDAAPALCADEAMAASAVARWRVQFATGTPAARGPLSLLIAAGMREQMNCRARALVRICSQREGSC